MSCLLDACMNDSEDDSNLQKQEPMVGRGKGADGRGWTD